MFVKKLNVVSLDKQTANHWVHSITEQSGFHTNDKYCIEGIRETPNASADFYCQSNTNNLTRTSCAFYEESLQVDHRLYTQKERARYCEMGREGEKRDGVRIQRGFNRG